jgi:pilus assembly protein CpaB
MDESALRDRVAGVVEAVGGRRRLLAAGLVGVAVLAALRAVTPGTAGTVAVWVAAHDLAGGRPLAATDVRTLSLPAADVPGGVLRAGAPVVGRMLADPMRRGEPLTDVRLLGPSLLASLKEPGLVAVPVRVEDGAAAAALVHPGDVVDVLSVADPAGGTPGGTVATSLRVLAVPERDDGSGDGGGVVVVAATAGQAAALARASAAARLSLVLRRP